VLFKNIFMELTETLLLIFAGNSFQSRTVWDNCPNYIKEKLEHINYEAARIITGARKLTSIRILLQSKMGQDLLCYSKIISWN
jgi:hypothetical protein